MPNQPAAGTTRIQIRLPDEVKADILQDVERILAADPDSQIKDMSAWIRAAIDAQLRKSSRRK